MALVDSLAPYLDEQGNRISFEGSCDSEVAIRFRGANNRVVVADPIRLMKLQVDFDCDNGVLEIGPSAGVPALRASIRIGQDSRVQLGANVSSTSIVSISATEGTSVVIGDDVMFASSNEVRADDGHAIFDVRTGARVNVSRSIHIGNHVWMGLRSVALSGAHIGDGSVIGLSSIVTRTIPNNCLAVGVPARPARYDIAWERPHLSLDPPFYKPDSDSVPRSPYWNLTERERADRMFGS